MKSRSALPGRPFWVGRGGPSETDRSQRWHPERASLTASQIPNETPRASSLSDGGAFKARVGDRIEVRERRGRAVRSGLIVELLGGPESVHFLVRWNEHHESLVFPSRDVRIVPVRP